MFTEAERAELGARVVAALEQDERVERVERFGSLTTELGDRHSDVDLAVVVGDAFDPADVAAEWAARARSLVPVLHSFRADVGGTKLSSFLLENHLEIDLAFLHASVLAGGIDGPPPDRDEQAREWLDFAWHDVVHAGVAIERGRPLRALFYLDRMRHRVVELACARYGLDARHHKAADELPAETRTSIAGAVPGSLGAGDLRHALRCVIRAFYAETRFVDADASERLEASLLTYVDELEST